MMMPEPVIPEMPLLQSPLPEMLTGWIEAARTTGAAALIDKEETWTSFDVVAKLRRLFKVKRVGHAGTLDPLATGLLVLCFGPATKQISLFQDATKQYETVVKLGATTATDDRGSVEIAAVDVVATDNADDAANTSLQMTIPTETQVREALLQFLGTIEQTPPAFAAIRHQGKRQYDLARDGIAFEERKRTVEVLAIDDVHYEWPFVRMSITCSKGTYIRSIARDLGAALGTGGYVWTLRRTAIGDMRVDNAVTVAALQAAMAQLSDSEERFSQEPQESAA